MVLYLAIFASMDGPMEVSGTTTDQIQTYRYRASGVPVGNAECFCDIQIFLSL